MAWTRWLPVFVLVALAGCGPEGERLERENVTVSDVRLVELESGARVVSGVIHNRNASEMAGLQIQISLFDADNRRVDTMPVLIQDLKAGERRRFREEVDSDHDIRGVRPRSLLFL